MNFIDICFKQVLSLSLSGCFFIAFALVLRLFFNRYSKLYSYILWILVFVKLILPFGIPVQMYKTKQTLINTYYVYYYIPQNFNFNTPSDNFINAAQSPNIQFNFGTIWLIAALVIIAKTVFDFIKLKNKVKNARNYKDNIYLSDCINTPFVMGVFNPQIYIPQNIPLKWQEYVILHEKIHTKRKDNIFKIFAFFVCCIHWFNPLVWLSFILCERDMEASCDEAVIKILGESHKKEYSSCLLALSAGINILPKAYLSFGSGKIKNRIKNVLHYKKPLFLTVCISVLILVLVAVSVALKPQEITSSQSEEEFTGTGSYIDITKENAEQFIQDTLSSFVIHSDGKMTFKFPQQMPKGEDIQLNIILTATYYKDGSVFENVSIIPQERSDWVPGEQISVTTDTQNLGEVMFGVSFRQYTSPNTFTDYLSDYVTFTSPFDYGSSAQDKGAQISYENGKTVIKYTFSDGKESKVSLELPQDLQLNLIEEDLYTILLVKQEDMIIGQIDLYPLATYSKEDLESVNTSENTIPMQIFATTDLANHVNYEDYTVVKSDKAFACATAKYTWQDLADDNYSAAAEIPWQKADCILAYHWENMPYYMQIIITEGNYSPQQLAEIAQSITIEK